MDQSEITPTTAKLSLRIVSALRYFILDYETTLLTAACSSSSLWVSLFPTMYLLTLLKAATRFSPSVFTTDKKAGGFLFQGILLGGSISFSTYSSRARQRTHTVTKLADTPMVQFCCMVL